MRYMHGGLPEGACKQVIGEAWASPIIFIHPLCGIVNCQFSIVN